MGQLIVQAGVELLADHVGDGQAAGVVGQHVVGEQVRAFRDEGEQLGHQPGHAGAVHGGGFQPDGFLGVHEEAVFILRRRRSGRGGLLHHAHAFGQPARHLAPLGAVGLGIAGSGVGFIEHRHHGQGLALQARHPAAVLLARGLGGIEHEQDQVAALHRGARHLVHQLAQVAGRLVYAGGVEEHQLPARFGQDAAHHVARGLGHRGDDADLLLQNGVDEGRLAHVGPAHDGDEADAAGGKSPQVREVWCRSGLIITHNSTLSPLVGRNTSPSFSARSASASASRPSCSPWTRNVFWGRRART